MLAIKVGNTLIEALAIAVGVSCLDIAMIMK